MSQSQFYSQFLATVKLNEVAVDWLSEDLSYLQAGVWEADYAAVLAAATVAESLEAFFAADCSSAQPGLAVDLKFSYGSVDTYPAVAHKFGYIDDVKAGVPRTAYKSAVALRHRGCRKFAIP